MKQYVKDGYFDSPPQKQKQTNNQIKKQTNNKTNIRVYSSTLFFFHLWSCPDRSRAVGWVGFACKVLLICCWPLLCPLENPWNILDLMGDCPMGGLHSFTLLVVLYKFASLMLLDVWMIFDYLKLRRLDSSAMHFSMLICSPTLIATYGIVPRTKVCTSNIESPVQFMLAWQLIFSSSLLAWMYLCVAEICWKSFQVLAWNISAPDFPDSHLTLESCFKHVHNIVWSKAVKTTEQHYIGLSINQGTPVWLEFFL